MWPSTWLGSWLGIWQGTIISTITYSTISYGTFITDKKYEYIINSSDSLYWVTQTYYGVYNTDSIFRNVIMSNRLVLE